MGRGALAVVQDGAMWAFRYPTPAHSYQDNFTFVGTDFEPRPIYLKVQEWATR